MGLMFLDTSNSITYQVGRNLNLIWLWKIHKLMLQKIWQLEGLHKQPCMVQIRSARQMQEITQRYLKICRLLWELEEKPSLASLLVNIKEKDCYGVTGPFPLRKSEEWKKVCMRCTNLPSFRNPFWPDYQQTQPWVWNRNKIRKLIR